MKKLTNLVKESMTIEFSMEELRKDYKNASDVTGQEKKDMIAKYGIKTKKAQDIKDKILVLLKDCRKQKDKFDDNDVMDFLHLYDYSTTKMCAGLQDEPVDFVMYLKDYYFNRLKKANLESYALAQSLSIYRLSIAQKDLIKTYQKIVAAADEINPSEEKIDKDKKMEMINTRLTELMQDFKEVYLKRIEEYAKEKYKYYSSKENLNVLNSVYNKVQKAVDKYKEEKNIRFISYRDTTGIELERKVSKARDNINNFKAFTKMYPSEKSYLDKCHEDGERNFKSNILAISERLVKDELDVENISVSDVKNDPKFFEMMLSDGNKKLYLRSVFAAQFSTKMIPHFRFIITERK